jgi:hypothetical protein
MKFILHDWSDSQSLKILERIRDAMIRGYSMLIIEEFILPEKDCPMLSAMWDWEMMVFLNSLERSEGHWRKLLEDSGFQATFFYPPGDGQVCFQIQKTTTLGWLTFCRASLQRNRSSEIDLAGYWLPIDMFYENTGV